MLNINITNFRKEIYELIKRTIKYNEPINISTKDGNVVLMSEADYNGLIETLYLVNTNGIKDKLIKGKETSKEDCVSEKEVEW